MTFVRRFALFVPLLLAGCVSSDTVIKVNLDGTGEVIQTTLLSSEMMSQLTAVMQAMAQSMGAKENGSDSPKPADLFTEKEARQRAATMGEGVTFVSSRKIQTDRAEGMEATYVFKDVTQLRLSAKPSTFSPQGLGAASKSLGEDTSFRFSKLPNGHALLTVVFHQVKTEPQETPAPPVEPATPKEVSPEQIEQIKKLFAGLRVRMVVEVQGDLIETNSLYVDGSTVTLFEMDFAQLLSNEAKLRELAAVKNPSLEEARTLLAGLAGFKVNLTPELKIEFTDR